MVLCSPEATLGGKTFWKIIQQDTLFVIQEHKTGPPVWWASPFRILIRCNNYVVAQASSLDEIERDWKFIQENISQINTTNQLPANLSVLLISFLYSLHRETKAKMGQTLDKDGNPIPKEKDSTWSERAPSKKGEKEPQTKPKKTEEPSSKKSDAPPSTTARKESVEADDPSMSMLSPEALTWAKDQFEQLSQSLNEQVTVDPTLDSIPLEISPEDVKFGEFLGEGVYSEVYKGMCYGTAVAVKKFKNQGFDPDFLKEVRKEVRIMKSIRHPNLLLFLGACTKPGHVMIVTELMSTSFHDLNKLNTPLLKKLKMAKEAAKGISWLHSLSPVILHRDLKPENILMDNSGHTVKVADFGLSLVKDHSVQEKEEMKKIRGSPAFMSPEALLGKDLTPGSDVYSFGMILWELITGNSPYEDLEIESFEQLIQEICTKGTREKIPENTPNSLKALIEACWQHSPASRPNFLQIVNQLDVCMLETSIADKDGRKIWKQHFSTNNVLRTEISWKEFISVLQQHTKLSDLNQRQMESFKNILAKGDTVTIEGFGQFLQWFGTIQRGDQFFLTNMLNLFEKKWFHGDISLSEAETRLASQNDGTFLIRFSSNAGSYALSRISESEKKEKIFVHIRIQRTPAGKFSFVSENELHEYPSLDELVKSPLLSLKEACPGSKYFYSVTSRVKHIQRGYVHDVGSLQKQ
eukprot:TRINITY_DN2796_c0_g1_i2.p1 TRINITY_DN2796_c0_g1~~TRINITY_DN2796_c0_g1_i2.p1  ORF type:complete len:694 (-),score=199.01 TRINITY_DN2796_c0_g1_i2:38-2119(-)